MGRNELPLDDEQTPASVENVPPPPPYAGESGIGTILPVDDGDSALAPSSASMQAANFASSRKSRWGIGLLGAVVGISAALLIGVLMNGERSIETPEDSNAVNLQEIVPTPEPIAVVEDVFSSCPQDMVFVPAGKFFMGTTQEEAIFATARPPKQRVVEGFCMDRHEVTVRAYRECSDQGECLRAHRNPMYPRGSQSKEEWRTQRKQRSELCNEGHEDRLLHPVNCVSWQQAHNYCETQGKRLPSEEEWEFTARGSDGRVYSWGDAPPSSQTMNGCGSECRAWKREHGLAGASTLYEEDDGFAGTAPVGSFASGRSQHGAMDMAGNVFEWTSTRFEEESGNEGERYVIRGGAFNSTMPQFADPALRFGQDAEAYPDAVGFRCAKAAEKTDEVKSLATDDSIGEKIE